MQTLSGHTSPETAYLVEDYPFGFRLRCQIRYWLEHKPKHGFRFVSQTSNPKRPGTWNKPKASTYAPCAVMLLDNDGHVTWTSLKGHGWATPEEIDAFAEQHAAALTDAHRAEMKYLRAVYAANKRITYKVTGVGHAQFDGNGLSPMTWTDADGNPIPEPPRQTIEEQARIVNAVVRDEYRKLTAAEQAPAMDYHEQRENFGLSGADLDESIAIARANMAAPPRIVVTRSGNQALLSGFEPAPVARGDASQTRLF